ncbi:hypothetical protein PIB30_085815 [Stylosanthes scabra]|uniref:Uncharacterized protein n=1 Tax=Stylosanthes scabra TaxID=79078 RepID=A0ABU6RTR7_9FABA|nr:hypothetical protein [Stylosanthes scabra]
MEGTNPVPDVLCIHNNVEPRFQQNSSKSRITGKNSPWSNWASKRQGLGPEMQNSNSGPHLKSLCSIKLHTQFMGVAYAIYGSCVCNSIQRALWKLAEEEVAYAIYKIAYTT